MSREAIYVRFADLSFCKFIWGQEDTAFSKISIMGGVFTLLRLDLLTTQFSSKGTPSNDFTLFFAVFYEHGSHVKTTSVCLY